MALISLLIESYWDRKPQATQECSTLLIGKSGEQDELCDIVAALYRRYWVRSILALKHAILYEFVSTNVEFSLSRGLTSMTN